MDITDIIKLIDEDIAAARKSNDVQGADWEVSEDPLDDTYGVEYEDTYNAGFVQGGAHYLSKLRQKIAEAS